MHFNCKFYNYYNCSCATVCDLEYMHGVQVTAHVLQCKASSVRLVLYKRYYQAAGNSRRVSVPQCARYKESWTMLELT